MTKKEIITHLLYSRDLGEPIPDRKRRLFIELMYKGQLTGYCESRNKMKLLPAT